MKTKIAMVVLTVFLQWSVSIAQKSAGKPRLHFQSVNQAGVLVGSKEHALQLQTVNGIRSKTWFAGLGVGLDYYHVRSIPVFLDVRKNILAKPTAPFVYADGGYNFPWISERDSKESDWIDENYVGGLYYDAGIGYNIAVSEKMQLLFSAGYSLKKSTQTLSSKSRFSMWPTVNSAYETYNYTSRKIAVKVGLVF